MGFENTHLHPPRASAARELDQERRRGQPPPDPPQQDPYKPEPPHGGSQTPQRGAQGHAEPRKARGAGKDGLRLRVSARRIRIDPRERREEYIRRLEEVFSRLNGIAEDPEGSSQIQVRALQTMIQTLRMCYVMIRDIDVENLEEELRELEKADADQKRSLPYRIAGEGPQGRAGGKSETLPG